MRDELLGYYERELIFLRRMGADFARRYPKIASRLQIDEEKVEDPHVERMIEALDLRKPIFKETARFGHFGRDGFSWEKTDKADALLGALSDAAAV